MEGLNLDFPVSDKAKELRRDAYQFKLAAEKPLYDLILKERCGEWLDCLVTDPGNTSLREDLLGDIVILEADVTEAVQAEAEFRDNLERARAENFGT